MAEPKETVSLSKDSISEIEFSSTISRLDTKIDSVSKHVSDHMEKTDAVLHKQYQQLKDSLHKNEVSNASYPTDMSDSIEKYDAKKTANKRAFNSMLGTAAGMFLTILGMVFAGLWFSIESEDFKVSQKTEISQLRLEASLEKELAKMRFESLLANSKLHDDIEAGAKIIATRRA
jgi:hypothetical protein